MSTVCAACKSSIGEEDKIRVPFGIYHTACFRCKACGEEFLKTGNKQIYESKGKVYCNKCYMDILADADNDDEIRCGDCERVIKGDYVEAFHHKFHPDCLTKVKQLRAKCKTCGKKISDDEAPVRWAGIEGYFHEQCFQCTQCGNLFTEDNPPGSLTGSLVCKPCHKKTFEEICAACGRVIDGTPTLSHKLRFHRKCLICTVCKKDLMEVQRFVKNNKLYCKDCN